MLHWGIEHLRQHLLPGVESSLKSAEADQWLELSQEEQTRMPIWNGKTGELVIANRAKPFTRFSRAKLCAVLKTGLDVRYSKELTDIIVQSDGTVKACFTDNSSCKGDVLVGADSASSFVRKWLLGHEKARCSTLPMITYNFSASYPAHYARWLRQQPHRLMRCAIHPDQNTWYMISTVDVPQPDRPETWKFQHFMNYWSEEAPPQNAAERLAHFRDLAKAHCEPFRSAAERVPEETYVPFDRIKYWAQPILWNNHSGRVTLAGDAAHPFPPCMSFQTDADRTELTSMLADRAQGLNVAVQDAAEFVDTIVQLSQQSDLDQMSRNEHLSSQITAYDRQIFERGQREIEASVRQSYSTTHFDAYLSSPMVKYGHNPTSTPPESAA